MGFLVILISVVIVGVALFFRKQREDSLIDEGKIIKRDAEFYESAQLYSIKGYGYEEILNAVNNTNFTDCKVSIYPNYGERQCILFKSNYAWNAMLTCIEAHDNDYKYEFKFTAWEGARGIPRVDIMNMMLTSIEKMFLGLDSNVKVETRRMKINTKRSFF